MIQVVVELKSGERKNLESRWKYEHEKSLKENFNVSIRKEIYNVLFDTLRNNLIDSDIDIDEIKSIHFEEM